MSEAINEKLLDKIRKLKAKRDRTDNEDEAAAFAAKVQEMLAKAGLEESMLGERKDDDLGDTKWNMQYCDSWHRQLCSYTAKLYFCKIYVFRHGGHWTASGGWKDKKGIAFVGRKNNIAVAREMAEYLITTTHRLGQEYGKRTEGRPEGAAARQFMRGCAARLVNRLYKLYEAQADTATPTHNSAGNPSNLPALYADEFTLADLWMANQFGEMKKTGRGFSRSGSHAAEGARAGESISLNTQITSKKGNLLS